LIKKDIHINIQLVSEKDHRFLYQLLKERKSTTNISHKKMPTFREHANFVLLKPYSKWYIIFNHNKKIGSIYISKQDEIGLDLRKSEWKEKFGEMAITLLMEKNQKERYLVNINPKNKKMLKFYKNKGFQLIQYTYELEFKD
jgi:RimJ/RimL family protein N-acetyltransferase